jgi:hypothetical protein
MKHGRKQEEEEGVEEPTAQDEGHYPQEDSAQEEIASAYDTQRSP